MLTTFKAIIEKARTMGGKRIAIAGAEGRSVLEAVKSAIENGIIEPILVGNSLKIKEIAKEIGLHVDEECIVDEPEEAHVAERAVELVSSGYADGLMKGKVNTPNILKAVLNKKYNLRTDRLLSHIALLELPTYPKLLMVTDGGMVIRPDLKQKAEILRNGAEMMQKLGIERPKIAILTAIETVNPDMPETEDADALKQMAIKGEFGDVVVEGPLAVDVAFSTEAARIKGVKSKISGDVDICLMPDVACGNIFAKGLWHLANARIGGLVLGARKPVILLSRSDNSETKLNSIALGAVTS